MIYIVKNWERQARENRIESMGSMAHPMAQELCRKTSYKPHPEQLNIGGLDLISCHDDKKGMKFDTTQFRTITSSW